MDFDRVIYFLFATLLLVLGVVFATCWLWTDSSHLELAGKIVTGIFSGILSLICIIYAILLYSEEVFA